MIKDLKFSNNQPETVTKYVVPQKVVTTQDAENAEYLIQDNNRQAIIFNKIEYCTIKKGGYVVLDMGCEIHGGVVVTLDKFVYDSLDVRITFGESVMEALSSIGEKNATNQHSIRDLTFTPAAAGSISYGNTGYRFIKIEAISADTNVKSVQGTFTYRDIEYKGSFECNDEKINKIWQVGAYTAHLNMQDYLWDGIKRDRLVWMGDTHPEVLTICSVFGDNNVIPKSLDIIMDTTPIGSWMNTFPTYTNWWVINHMTWYMQNGDLEYLKSISGYLYKTLESIIDCVKPGGELEYKSYFCDWSSAQTDGELPGAYAVTISGLKAGKYLCEVLGNTKLADKCNAAVEELLKKNFDKLINKQTAALYSLAGGIDSKEISDKLLLKGGAEGFSTFLGGYVLRVLHNGGYTKEALQIMKEYWGAMLDFGATTFWEDFDIDWVTDKTVGIDQIVPDGMTDIHGDFGKFCYIKFRHSLCHGWASGPTSFLSQVIGGIEILEPGCKKVRISPNLGGLEYIKVKYPTPYGLIEINADKDNVDIKVPDEIELVK